MTAAIIFTALVLSQGLLVHVVVWQRLKPLLVVARARKFDEPVSAKYIGYDLLALPIIFIVGPMIGYGWYLLIKSMFQSSMNIPSDALISIGPPNAYWMIPAIFLAFQSLFTPADLLCRWLLGSRYEDYIIASFRRQRRYSPWLLPWINWFTSFLAAAMMWMACDWHVYFRTDSITINRLFSFGEASQKYEDVTDVAVVAATKARNGKITNRLHVKLRFRDGTSWSTIEDGIDADHATNDRIIELLQQKTPIVPRRLGIDP